MPKKTADNHFQIQYNLAPVFQCFIIDRKVFKQRRIETSEKRDPNSDRNDWNGNKRNLTQTNRTDIRVACAHDDMFSSFNTARKAVWLTRKSYVNASDRKDSLMLLRDIRESKARFW